jgi:hypothetical protein
LKLRSPGIRGSGTRAAKPAATTAPGYRNPKGQVVISSTGARSTTHPRQTIYRLRCGSCLHEYGANGIDIHERCCPACQGGMKGEPLREPPPMFDFGD